MTLSNKIISKRNYPLKLSKPKYVKERFVNGSDALFNAIVHANSCLKNEVTKISDSCYEIHDCDIDFNNPFFHNVTCENLKAILKGIKSDDIKYKIDIKKKLNSILVSHKRLCKKKSCSCKKKEKVIS